MNMRQHTDASNDGGASFFAGIILAFVGGYLCHRYAGMDSMSAIALAIVVILPLGTLVCWAGLTALLSKFGNS